MSYGANLAEPYRLMGTYTGRILKGEKPADLRSGADQVRTGDQSQTARRSVSIIPPGVLAIADEVIE